MEVSDPSRYFQDIICNLKGNITSASYIFYGTEFEKPKLSKNLWLIPSMHVTTGFKVYINAYGYF